MNKAVEELRTGLAYARADYDPQWYGMGDAAHAAMRTYPPFVAWKKGHQGEEIDAVCLRLAATPDFEKFLTRMFPD